MAQEILNREKMTFYNQFPSKYTQEGEQCLVCWDPFTAMANCCVFCRPSEVETIEIKNDFISMIKEITNNGKKYYNDNDGLTIETSSRGSSGRSSIGEVGPISENGCSQIQNRGKPKESGRLGKGKAKNPGKGRNLNLQVEREEASQSANFQKYSIFESDEIKVQVKKTTKRKTESFCQNIKKKPKLSKSTGAYYFNGCFYNDINVIVDEIKVQSGKIDQTKEDQEESHKKLFEGINDIEKQEQVEYELNENKEIEEICQGNKR